MLAYTPPPSPPPHAHFYSSRARMPASPRRKARRADLAEHPAAAAATAPRPSSPELIFSMSPVPDSHVRPAGAPAPLSKSPLNPGALFARARQQSAAAFAALAGRPTRPRTPLLYSFPGKSAAAHQLSLPAADAPSRTAEAARYSPVSHPDPAALRTSTIPISIPLPTRRSGDSIYGDLDEDDYDELFLHADGPHRAAPSQHPRKIVGFHTGVDADDLSSPSSSRGSPFRLELLLPSKEKD